MCVQECDKYQMLDTSTKYYNCIDKCPEKYYIKNRTCVSGPCEKFYSDSDGRHCVESCTWDVYLYEYQKECVKKCPKDAPYVVGRTC